MFYFYYYYYYYFIILLLLYISYIYWNLIPVTIGNFIGGGIFVGG